MKNHLLQLSMLAFVQTLSLKAQDISKAMVLATGTSSARTEADRWASAVNVKDFGAIGDGKADDTTAMQAAHSTGRLVYYPAGTYLFSTIVASSGGITGDGPTQTVLTSVDTSTNNLMTFVGAWVNNVGADKLNSNNVFLFRDFSISVPSSAKSNGAGIQISAPLGRENQQTSFQNITFYNCPIGIDFVAGSFWKVNGCTFIGSTTAGIQVANVANADSGDSVISNCTFETNPGPNNPGVLQKSSGGLKITGNKFLGGSYGYLLAYNGTINTSNLVITGNSFELMTNAGVGLTRVSGGESFKNIVITGNQFAESSSCISTDSSGFISNLTIAGNVLELWAQYASTTYCIGLNSVDNYNISGNVLKGNGGNSTGISILNCTNGKIGTNSYSNLNTAIVQSGPEQAFIAKDSLQGSATVTSSGWTSYGYLFQSPLQTVTFEKPFLIAPSTGDIQLSAGDGSGTVGGIVASVSTKGFTFIALNVFSGKTSVINWKADGIL